MKRILSISILGGLLLSTGSVPGVAVEPVNDQGQPRWQITGELENGRDEHKR